MTDELDFEMRELCPDGGCVGLIGPDGHCKVCGRPRDLVDAAPYRSEPAEVTDLDLDSRELCSDGACTGVIGDDGRCRTCGRPRAAS
jgi:hypothetical protein